jgi:queuine tRNA-ribosyltransferase
MTGEAGPPFIPYRENAHDAGAFMKPPRQPVEEARKTKAVFRKAPGGVVFMPDATHGVIRGLSADDLERTGTQMLMMNAFHLANRPGVSVVRSLGGLHAMTGWSGPIATDSGGFQMYSIAREGAGGGRVHDEGLTIFSEARGKTISLTPEKSITNQLRLRSDLMFVLDQCTHPADSPELQEVAVSRTIAWAKRCKQTYRSIVDHGRDTENRPLLYGVIQGGQIPNLRRRCAEALLEIGFDGFGFGGWPYDSEFNLIEDTLSLTRELVPKSIPMHALGVGHPRSIVACALLGYQLFDSSLPTRDARQGRLYTFLEARPQITRQDSEWLDMIYIKDERHVRSSEPISPHCPQVCCTQYSRAYLNHLFVLKDAAYVRLATLHNLTFMQKLVSLVTQALSIKRTGPEVVESPRTHG